MKWGFPGQLNIAKDRGELTVITVCIPKYAPGFTIIEVLIVLAVSGAMLTSALALINGRQNVAAFNQAIRNVQSELQKTVNDVSTGSYVSDNNIKCQDTGASLKLTTVGAPEQGANTGCVFLGDVLQFAVGTADPQPYNVYSVAGLQNGLNGSPASLFESKARLIAKGAGDPASVPNVFETKLLLYGLTVTKMYYGGNAAQVIGAVGYAASLGNLATNDVSQQVDLIALRGTGLHANQSTGVKSINTSLASGPLSLLSPIINPPNGVQICFASGGTNQSGLITLGDQGRQGTIDLKIFGNKSCS